MQAHRRRAERDLVACAERDPALDRPAVPAGPVRGAEIGRADLLAAAFEANVLPRQAALGDHHVGGALPPEHQRLAVGDRDETCALARAIQQKRDAARRVRLERALRLVPRDAEGLQDGLLGHRSDPSHR
jgi:hypothetical protein